MNPKILIIKVDYSLYVKYWFSLVAFNGFYFSWRQTEMAGKYLLVSLLLLSFSWRESKKETNPHLNFDNLMIIRGLCLKCWVGHYSQKVREINLMECSNATRYIINAIVFILQTRLKKCWSLRIHGVDVSFGDDSGSDSSDWVCEKLPSLGTITKDCVLMVSFSDVNGEHIKTLIWTF